MKIIKGVLSVFVGIVKVLGVSLKLLVLLLLRRRRVLRVKKTSEATILLRRLLNKGLITPSVLSKKMAKSSEQDMRKQVKKGFKKGRVITVDDLTKTVKEDASFLALCEEIGLSLNFFKGLAENAIKEYEATRK